MMHMFDQRFIFFNGSVLIFLQADLHLLKRSIRGTGSRASALFEQSQFQISLFRKLGLTNRSEKDRLVLTCFSHRRGLTAVVKTSHLHFFRFFCLVGASKLSYP